ncbi:MAG TPA: efflux transporter periplasmic adaptor subunit, partial [Thermoanaerobaculia bacterium]
IAPNQAVLTIVNLSSFELDLPLPEEYAAETTIGTPAIIAFEGREFTGNVIAISPEVVNSQVTARVAFNGATPVGLKQSQRLTTRLVFESKRDVLKVARGAFVESGGGRVAYVVNGQSATRRPVVLGATSVNEVEVVSGLREGETIVVSDTTPFENANEILLR